MLGPPPAATATAAAVMALTDAMADATAPAWDRDGKHLYFLASTDFGLNVGWLDLSSFNVPFNHAIYLAVLSADQPSPLSSSLSPSARKMVSEFV